MTEPSFRNPLKDNTYRVIDGDTIVCVIDRGWKDTKTTALRIHGIDAPEKSTRRNLLEREAGGLVRDVVVKWMAAREDRCFYASSEVRPKYADRSIGRLWPEGGFAEGDELSVFLLEGGFVRDYHGKKREPWPDEQLHTIIAKAKAYLAAE